MYQVFNSLTGEAIPVLSDNPYDLAGPLGERRQEQKRDEQGNLVYLKSVEDVITAENGQIFGAGTFTYEETMESAFEYTIEDDDGSHTYSTPYPPVLVDAGPLYEWREVAPTEADQAAEVQRSLVNAVQEHLDAAAKARGYDNIFSACTYAEESAVQKFQDEGRAFRAWRSLVWQYCYAQLDAVTAGTRVVPTANKLISELPVLAL